MGPAGPTGPLPALSFVSATSAQTTASTTFVSIPDMSLTPGAGDYLVHLSVQVDGADTGANDHAVVAIYLNGVLVTGTERRVFLPRDRFGAVSTQAHLTGLGPTDSVEGRWRAIVGSTLTINDRNLSAIEVN